MRKLTRRKKALYTCLVMLIALSPFVLLEVGLRLSGWHPATEISDPYLGLDATTNLFRRDPSGAVMVVREERLDFFRPDSFSASKPRNGFRVFVLGGSTVQGRPWETETSFAAWLQIHLQSHLLKKNVEVVNCGGVSYASYRLMPIFREVLSYEPDLLIVCTGHNEFLEDRTYAELKSVPLVLRRLHGLFSFSQAYQFLRHGAHSLLHSGADRRPKLSGQLITRLDYQNGLDRFTPETIQRESVQTHFRHNLETMVRLASQQGIRLLLIAPPSNQKDCVPLKPSPEWEAGQAYRYQDFALPDFETVQGEVDAEFHFFYGRALLRHGRIEAAREQFNLAIDSDLCPLRMTSQLRSIMQTVFERHFSVSSGLAFVDLQDSLEKIARQSIIGDDLLIDHVHPKIRTNQWIAQHLLEHLQDLKWVPRVADAERVAALRIESKLQSLDFSYYQRGRDRLMSVLRWSRGQAINAIPEDEGE